MKSKVLFLLLQAFIMLCGTAKAALADVVTSNTVGATVSFTSSGSYEWEWDSQKQKMRSTNYHVDSSTSQTTITISTSSSCDFSFDYEVSSESSYDKLTITLDGSTIVNAISGTTSSTYISTLSSGSHTLVLKYTKDSSDDSNDDRAYVSNMKFLESGSTEIPEGVIQSGSCGENISFVLNEDGTLVISGSGKMFDYYGSSTPVPWFTNRNEIKEVQIEYGVESIGDYAFYKCSTLTSVTIPNSVTRIGDAAFKGCSNLPSISIPNSVMTVGEYVFDECKNLPVIDFIRYADTYLVGTTLSGSMKENLTSVNIKEDTKWIGNDAFSGCSNLSSVTIPESVTSIGYYAFSGCPKLTSITIPKNVTKIGFYAFSGCSGLTSLVIPNSVTKIDHGAFSNCCGLTSITIGKSVTSIGAFAFKNCSGITSVIIPNSVTSIGENAFKDCTGLTTVSIGNNVPSIESNTFSGCSNVKELIYADGCTTALRTGLTSVEKVVIPNSVTKIEDRAFTDFSALTSVTIPNSVTSIGVYAFSSSGLISVNIPNSVMEIKSYAFSDCSGLTSLTIPNSVVSIGYGAFCDCSSLTSVIISNGVTSIGAYAFEGCSGLNSVTIPNSVTSIGDAAFKSCSALTSVTIPNGVTDIKQEAFYGCSALTSVSIPNSVMNIGSYAFRDCSVLNEVYCYIEKPLSISSSTFYNCNLSEATLYVPRKSVDSYKKAYCWKDFGTILPIPIPAETITITCEDMENSVISLSIGSTCTLTATLTPSDATDEVTWSSSNTNVATISEAGVLTAIAIGKTIITAETSNGISASCEIIITKETLVDGEAYDNPTTATCNALTFTKTFSSSAAGKWNAFYVPMSVNVEDYAGELDFAEIYAFCAMKDTNWDGVVDANDDNYLYVFPLTSGITKPNVPYLVRPREAKTYVINSADNVLYATAQGIVEFSTARDKFTVKGLYEPFTVVAGDNNYYVSSTGTLDYRTTGSTTVKANRWVMHRESKEYGGGSGNSPAASSSYRIVAIGEDIDELTAIKMINAANERGVANVEIYSLDGRKVTNTRNLRNGLYIKNGQKIIVK